MSELFHCMWRKERMLFCEINGCIHRENMSVKCIPLQTLRLYSKTGVCGGIPIFLIFAPKHRLWALVRSASRVPTINVLSKNKKNIKFFPVKIIIFTTKKLSVYGMCLFS